MSLRRYLQKGMWSDKIKEKVRAIGHGLWTMGFSYRLSPIAYCLLFAFCILFFTGCAAKDAELKQPAKDYFVLLNKMTKSKKVIEKLDSKLFVSATYKDWPLREAYIDEYARRYQMDENQKARLNQAEKDAEERFNDFFMAVYTPDEKWNDFEQPLSIWRIYMEDERGNRVSPIEIKKADVASPLIREFYPYLDLWSSGYIIRFPKYMIGGEEPFPEKDARLFKLVITGVVGKAELEWRLKNSE